MRQFPLSLALVLLLAPGAPARAQSGGIQRPASMWGTWCYQASVGSAPGPHTLDRACFTLHPDGRYVYGRERSISVPDAGTYDEDRDSGVWGVQGPLLLAQSARKGLQQFTLGFRNMPNGDPMLCLNEACFVTQLARPSW